MATQQKTTTKDLVFTALFAALTYVGTSIRVPMPAAIGNPFVHLGNSVLLLAVLLIGYKRGALAGGIGFAIFDVFNGFAVEAPYFFFESLIVGGAAALVWRSLKEKPDSLKKLFIVALSAAGAKLIMTFLKGIGTNLIIGTSLTVAVTASTASLYVTVINCITTIIIVSLTYFPLKKSLDAIYSR